MEVFRGISELLCSTSLSQLWASQSGLMMEIRERGKISKTQNLGFKDENNRFGDQELLNFLLNTNLEWKFTVVGVGSVMRQ